MRLRIANIILIIAIIMADLLIYGVLGLFFMGYDDFYDESKGPYMSLQSMTSVQKALYIVINLWYIVNIILIIWAVFKFHKWFKNQKAARKDTEKYDP